MTRRLKLVAAFLLLVVSLAGCEETPVLSTEEQARTILPTAPALASAPTSIATGESGLLAKVSQAVHENNAEQCQLHDVQVNGDYVYGRFSINNQLRPEKFWAKLSAGSWQIVFLGGEPPACAALNGFPDELQAGCREDVNQKQISNFEDCVKAGYQPTADEPRHCLDGNNNLFVEVGAGQSPKRYVSHNVRQCGDLDFDCGVGERAFLDDGGCGCQR